MAANDGAPTASQEIAVETVELDRLGRRSGLEGAGLKQRKSLFGANCREFAGITPVVVATATACGRFIQYNLWRAVSRCAFTKARPRSIFPGCFSSCGPSQAFLLAPGQHDRGQWTLRVDVRSHVNKGRQILQPSHVCALISGPLSPGVIAREGNQRAFTPSVSNRDGEAVASDTVLRRAGKEC